MGHKGPTNSDLTAITMMAERYFQPPPWYKNIRVHGLLQCAVGLVLFAIVPWLSAWEISQLDQLPPDLRLTLPPDALFPWYPWVLSGLFCLSGTATYVVGCYRLGQAVSRGLPEPPIGKRI